MTSKCLVLLVALILCCTTIFIHGVSAKLTAKASVMRYNPKIHISSCLPIKDEPNPRISKKQENAKINVDSRPYLSGLHNQPSSLPLELTHTKAYSLINRLHSYEQSKNDERISAIYPGWNLEKVPENVKAPSIKDEERFDHQEYIPNIIHHHADVPEFNHFSYYDSEPEKGANDGYSYALDANRTHHEKPPFSTSTHTFSTSIRKKRDREPNAIFDFILPGSFLYNTPDYSPSKKALHRSFIYFSRKGEQACESLRILMYADGVEYLKSIPLEEFTRPKHHYFAAIVQDRDNTDSNVGHIGYHPMYFRLNKGGIWSFKTHEYYTSSFRIPHPWFYYNEQHVKSFLQKKAFPKSKTIFCGFFKVPSAMKAFLRDNRHKPL